MPDADSQSPADEGGVDRGRRVTAGPVHRSKREHRCLICRAEQANVEELLARLEAIGARCGLDNSDPQQPVVTAWMPGSLKSAHTVAQRSLTNVWVELWTTDFECTPYSLCVDSLEDADAQLDFLSEALVRPRESWTIKPSRGWMSYGMPPK